MSTRKINTIKLTDATPSDHLGRWGEITYRDGYLYYHDGVTPGGELIGGGGSGGGGPTTWTSITGMPSFAAVATSGAYADLTGKPATTSVFNTGTTRSISGEYGVSDSSGTTVVAGGTGTGTNMFYWGPNGSIANCTALIDALASSLGITVAGLIGTNVSSPNMVGGATIVGMGYTDRGDGTFTPVCWISGEITSSAGGVATFGGGLTFQDNTVQTTAYTGEHDHEAYEITNTSASGTTHSVSVGTDGMISFPVIDGERTLWGAVDEDFNIKTTRTEPGIDADISILSADDIWMEAGDDIDLKADGTVRITSDNAAAGPQWSFGTDGTLTLPSGGAVDGNFVDGQWLDVWLTAPEGATKTAGVRDFFGKTVAYVNEDSFIIQTNRAVSTRSWIFGEDGILTLPAGGTITEGGGLTGAIRLTPAGGANANQALVIYPTAGDGDHIHLTAGGGTTDLYLGNDNQYVQIQHSGHVVVQAADGVDYSQWLFNKNGDLTLPAGGDIKDSNGASVLGGGGVGTLDSVTDTGSTTTNGITVGSVTLTNGAVIRDTTGNAVAIGKDAGLTTQGTQAVAIGINAGVTTQGNNSVAIGPGAGASTQGTEAVAIGTGAGETIQGNSAVAVGYNAGLTTQGQNSVAIGKGAGSNSQGIFAVAIGRDAGYTTQGGGAVAMGRSAGDNTQGTSAVAIGEQAGETTQGNYSVAVGSIAGSSDQGVGAVAIGTAAGSITQGQNSVAVGYNAGANAQGEQAVAIGLNAGLTSQGNYAVAVGHGAGQTSQPGYTIILNATGSAVNGVEAQTDSFYVAPIRSATATANVLYYDTTTKEVTYGAGAVSFDGNYNSLTNKPTIRIAVAAGSGPGGNLQADSLALAGLNPTENIPSTYGGDLILQGGVGGANGDLYGEVRIKSGTIGANYEWHFTTDKKIKLPAGGSIVDSTGTSVLGGSGSYAPAVPANWASPAPTTIAEALNRIAAKLLTLGGDLP